MLFANYTLELEIAIDPLVWINGLKANKPPQTCVLLAGTDFREMLSVTTAKALFYLSHKNCSIQYVKDKHSWNTIRVHAVK